MSTFKPGEIVDITIKGVRVTAMHHDPEDLPEVTVLLDCEAGSVPVRLPHCWPMVTVERVAPAEWPPQPGDLWKDCDGDTWYALLVEDDDTADETYVVLRPGRTSKHPSYLHSDNDGIRRTYGPMILAYREGGQS